MAKAPIRLQLAIQGGGAKICALIAAMDAIEELEGKDVIKITRIAGTSAGALIGTLFAAKIPMADVKDHFKSIDIDKIFGIPKKKTMLRGIITVPNQMLLLWRQIYMLWLFLRGKPFCKEGHFKEELVTIFKKNGNGATFFHDLKIPTHVTVTDIKNTKLKCYSDTDGIINSLVDSCAIPFFFRSHNSGGDSVILDGGICENLPSDVLLDYEDKDGPIIGISFTKTPGDTPKNLLQFCIALLNTAMDNSMDRAKRKLRSAVHSIDTEITTFDFYDATEFLNKSENSKSEYKNVKNNTEIFFRKIANDIKEDNKKKQFIKGDPWQAADEGDHWARAYTKLMLNVGMMYSIQNPTQEQEYLECTLIVTGGRKEEGENLYSADNVKAIGIYKAKNTIYNRSIYLSHAKHHTELEESHSKVTILKTKKAVKTIPIPIVKKEHGHEHKRKLLICFDPVIKKEDGAFEMEFVDTIKGFLAPLYDNKKRKDELAITTGDDATGTIGIVRIVVYLPNNTAFNDVKMKARTNAKNQGRLMNENELSIFEKKAPPEMKTLGWIGNNILPKERFVVDIIR